MQHFTISLWVQNKLSLNSVGAKSVLIKIWLGIRTYENEETRKRRIDVNVEIVTYVDWELYTEPLYMYLCKQVIIQASY